jgi:predicted RNase H-like nuclease (RuvC/YqgF family)
MISILFAIPGVKKALFGLAVISAFTAVVYGVYVYVTNLQNELTARVEQVIKLETVKIEQQKTINEMIANSERRDTTISVLNKELEDARNGISKLEKKFNKTSKLLGERDIGRLAVGRPELIERIINRGTEDVNRCFEILSGEPLTQEETDADRPSKGNTSCPNIANPNLIID